LCFAWLWWGGGKEGKWGVGMGWEGRQRMSKDKEVGMVRLRFGSISISFLVVNVSLPTCLLTALYPTVSFFRFFLFLILSADIDFMYSIQFILTNSYFFYLFPRSQNKWYIFYLVFPPMAEEERGYRVTMVPPPFWIFLYSTNNKYYRFFL
jgi:hypothetical protein